MSENIKRQLLKEYGIEILECVLSELAKIQGFERLIMVKHAHEYLVKECGAETAALLTDESIKAEYTALRNKLNAVAPAKKEQIERVIGIESITTFLNEE